MLDDSTYTYTLSGEIGADKCITTAPLILILERTSGGEKDWINYSELSDFDDTDPTTTGRPTDADSTPDSDGPGERAVEPGDAADGDLDSTDADGEEDDHDPAGIEIVDLALIKQLVTEGVIFEGDTIEFSITVYNQGSVATSDVLVYDHIPAGLTFINNIEVNEGWILENASLVAFTISELLPPGESIEIMISFIANGGDLTGEDYINVAEVGDIIDDNGIDVSTEDIDSLPDDDNENDNGGVVDGTTDDAINNEGGDEDDADPASVCIVDYFCPQDFEVPSCSDQTTIDAEFQMWLDSFRGENCDVTSVFADSYNAPDGCGGSIEVTFRVFSKDVSNQILLNECTRTFGVSFDDNPPVCPVDWNLSITYGAGQCIVAPYSTVVELESMTGSTVVDDCDDPSDLSLISFEEIVPAICSGQGDFFDSREVIRTYLFMDECGNTSELCPQVITYNFDQCNQISDAGRISVEGNTTFSIPPGCNAPKITETSPALAECDDLIEYMWLVSTVERSPGSPFIPNPLNTGIEGSGEPWIIIEGANNRNFTPDVIEVNTYYVRCSRSFSCCGYLETNLVAFIVDDDPNAECPIIDVNNNEEDCNEFFILTNPNDNLLNNQDTLYITNRTIEASNIINGGAQLILNARNGTTLNPGFEVKSLGQLEIYLEGCNDD